MAAENNKNLMALGSLAVLGVYAAGWYKTKAAADRFAADDRPRRPAPAPTVAAAGPMTVERVTPTPNAGVVQRRAGAVAAQPPLPEMHAQQATPAHDAAPPTAVATVASDSAVHPAVAVTPAPTTAPTTAPTPQVSLSSVLPDSLPPATPSAPLVAPEPAKPKLKDGTYYGWGTSRHGDIQASVTIENGRITSSMITQCLTRYSCSWIAALPPQVIQRQSPDVDYVSGATQSANAFYYAVLEALSHAK